MCLLARGKIVRDACLAKTRHALESPAHGDGHDAGEDGAVDADLERGGGVGLIPI